MRLSTGRISALPSYVSHNASVTRPASAAMKRILVFRLRYDARMNRPSPDVQCLRTLLVELVSFVEAATPETVDAINGTDFEFVTDLFLITQMEHLRAARSLLNARHFVAANIVGRAMFEGLVLLMWMNEDREQRSIKWRAWACVVDWRTLQHQDREASPVDDEQRKRVMEGIRRYGHMFLHRKPKDHDPYVGKWIPSIADMATSIGLYSLYDSVYRSDSQWVHWTAGGVGHVLSEEGGIVRYDFARESLEVGALNTIFHAAWHMFYNASRWFDTERAPAAFEPLSARFIACYKRTQSS
jgi:Family of unknown function (DUF5677)